jgi:hypothetical protein
MLATSPHTARGFPSPLRGGARGGGNPYGKCSAIPPSLTLPNKGGGNPRGVRGTADDR